MALIDLVGISKRFDAKTLFKDVSLHINESERIALLGQNGCGKSTLMDIVSGKIEPDEGRVIAHNNLTIGFLSQQPKLKPQSSVKEAIEQNLGPLKEAKERYDHISNLIATSSKENKALFGELEKLGAFLDHHNAWDLESKVKRIMQEFRLSHLQHRTTETLSGGEQRRVALATLLLQKPDILLLDEPTNHLDVYMVRFLEEFLLKERFTLLFVSHDRSFIDHIATRVVEVENKALVSYKGGYGSYLKQKEQRLQSMQKAYENLLKLLKQEEEWLSKSVRARLKRNEGRKARVEALRKEVKENPTLLRKIELELEREQKHFQRTKSHNKQKMLFEIEDLCFKHGEKTIIKAFSTRILQHDKIGIVGINGAGKSTLLKLLLGELQPTGGNIKRGEFRIGYFDQQRHMLDDDETLIGTFCPNGGDHIQVRGANLHVFAYLKQFLFPEEYLTRKIGELSGGEKNRVALALLFSKRYDCLILDEPTNDLDIQTINILEEQLMHFSGALLFVSHDRYFVDKIATKLFIFKGNGEIEHSYQSYSEYLENEALLSALQKPQAQEAKKVQKPKERKKRKLSYKEKLEIEELPAQIDALEEKIDRINACLSDPNCYKEIGLENLDKELQEAQVIYEQKSDRYLELLELLEELEGS